jgi:hypothetical protein
MLLAAEGKPALSDLPGEYDPGNTDHFRFDFETLLFLFAHLGIQLATVIAFGATVVAPGLVENFAGGDLIRVDEQRGQCHQQRSTDGN